MSTNLFEAFWGSFNRLEARYGIPRSSAYQHIENGDFRSRLVGNRRLIDFRSVDAYLEKCPERPSRKVSRAMTINAFKSADARAQKAKTK